MPSTALKKILRFGVYGAIGSLAGWLLGEPFLAIALGDPDREGSPSLVQRSEPQPQPDEFKKRLDAAGAKSGDIQISLLWNNSNDLDLHCIDPTGWEISFPKDKRRSPSGGNLDVDRNAGCNNTVAEPIENIYWPKGDAPAGEYKVFVDYFSHCGSAEFQTPYKVSVLVGNERKEYTGSNGTPRTSMPVTTFKVEPSLTVSAQYREIPLHSGQTTKVGVYVERRFCKGPIIVQAEGLPEGVTAEPVTIQADNIRNELKFVCVKEPKGLQTITITAKGSGAEAKTTMRFGSSSWWNWETILVTAVWTALVAAGLGAALVVGQNLSLGRSAFAGNRLAMIAGGSAAAGFVSGAFGQALQFVFASMSLPGSIGYFAGWLVLGGLLGFGVSYFIPNLARNKAVLAGLAGGFLGVCSFLVFSLMLNVLGRFAGAAILGASIGMMVAVVEAAFRKAWLQVKLGPREVITVNLGPEPVKLGSDNRACTVWAKGAAPVAVRAFVREGKVIWHDVPANRETVVGHGHTETVGGIEVTVMTGSGNSTPLPPPRSGEGEKNPTNPPRFGEGGSRSEPGGVPPTQAPVAHAPGSPKPSMNPDACPGCGRKVPGRTGARYCMVCDRTY